jgi:hypothetical protein
VLEKDVRYLDSRIALLIQNRMALEEVSIFVYQFIRSLLVNSVYSEKKLPTISKKLPKFKKAPFQTMRKHKNMATFCFSFNLNPVILRIYAD